MKKILKESIIKFSDVAYLRDLGGLETTDHKHIKYGMLYRSSHLSHTDEVSQKKLVDKLNISKVIDLRSPSELIASPEELISDIDYQTIQILDDNDNPAVTRKTRSAVLKHNMASPGGTKGHLINIYRKLINYERANKEYKLFFEEVLNSNGKPLIYHCTQGKDRTGVASTLLLLALGVDRETIISDYLYYNKVNRRKNIGYSIGMFIAFLSYKKAKALYYLLKAARSYIEAALDEIDKLGGALNYLVNYIGLNGEEINRLKAIYLE